MTTLSPSMIFRLLVFVQKKEKSSILAFQEGGGRASFQRRSSNKNISTFVELSQNGGSLSHWI